MSVTWRLVRRVHAVGWFEAPPPFRMENFSDLRVELALGAHRRAMTAQELELAIGASGLRAKLVAVLFDPSDPQPVHIPCGEDGGKGGQMGLGSKERTVERFSISVPVRGTKRGAGGEQGDVLFAGAVRLADALDDWQSLAFFRKVVASVPGEIVQEALIAALDVPRRELRRSRGAYFTAVLRRSLSERGESLPAPPI